MREILTRNFVLYLVSRFCSASGLTLLRAAVAWHVFDISGSAFHLGLIGLVQFAPALLLSLVGGAWLIVAWRCVRTASSQSRERHE